MPEKSDTRRIRKLYPQWVQDAFDCLNPYGDPDKDPITTDEVVFILREFESSDMDMPDEFLRRSA